MSKLSTLVLMFCCAISLAVTAQNSDSLKQISVESNEVKGYNSYNSIKPPFYKQIIIPSLLTTYGFLALKNKKLKEWDSHVKDEIWNRHPHQPNHFDDWLQYMPSFSVYVLNSLGVKGKNNLLDATRMYLISSLTMMVVVQSIKKITSLPRPDGFGANTFPSGHTSTAFVAAEFLNQEYKDRSPLIGIVGYLAASTVGYMRLYNNRHWFSDIISGAGIGIGITKLVYWVYPKIKKKFWPEKKQIPFY